jgi:transcriptional regulator with XRE-family HTH domain
MRGVVANGEQILAARIRRGLTQEQLAELSDLDVKTVRKAERGQRVDLVPLTNLARALQVEVSRLVQPVRSETDLERRRREQVMHWHLARHACPAFHKLRRWCSARRTS